MNKNRQIVITRDEWERFRHVAACAEKVTEIGLVWCHESDAFSSSDESDFADALIHLERALRGKAAKEKDKS